MIDFYCNSYVKTVRSFSACRFKKRVSGSPDKRMIFSENRTLSDKVQCLLYEISLLVVLCDILSFELVGKALKCDGLAQIFRLT